MDGSELAGYDPAMVLPIDEVPADTSLASVHGTLLRPVERAIQDFLDQLGERATAAAMEIAAE